MQENSEIIPSFQIHSGAFIRHIKMLEPPIPFSFDASVSIAKHQVNNRSNSCDQACTIENLRTVPAVSGDLVHFHESENRVAVFDALEFLQGIDDWYT